MTQMIIDDQNVQFYNSDTMCHWGGDEYYTVNGHQQPDGSPVIYIGGFPLEWATSHAPETGPMSCLNCLDYGSLRGVFIGYCANCATHVYNGERGLGFMGDGKEDVDGIGESAFDTYLSGICPKLIELISSRDVMSCHDSESLCGICHGCCVKCDNEMDVTVHGGPFNSDYEGGYNDF
jgi:hypothetical protein